MHAWQALSDYHSALEIEPQNQEVKNRISIIYFNNAIAYFNDVRTAHRDIAPFLMFKVHYHHNLNFFMNITTCGADVGCSETI